MTISAKMILDSISPQGIRLRTFLLRYPRFIHAELMTHRMFSRNASSSRAIPVHKMIADLRLDPAMPVYWGSAKPGMQAGDELTGQELLDVKAHWLDLMEQAIISATFMMQAGLHKQVANRVLEPWGHITVVVTATDFENFYALRRHKDAQPEIKELADLMWALESASMPKLLTPGDWHLPFINDDDWEVARTFSQENRVTRDMPRHEEILEVLKRVSVARCARTSYLTHEGKITTVPEDYLLYDRLVVSKPLHASPAEHQATPDLQSWKQTIAVGDPNNPDDDDENVLDTSQAWEHPHQHGNLRGWRQLRKMLPHEYTPG